jgi:putative tricarboxylic transport membrane protein
MLEGIRRRRRGVAVLAACALAPLTMAACGAEEESGSGGGGAAQAEKLRKLTILVGTEPGGGFDLTARAFAKAAEEADLANQVQVQNVPGAGNTIALARLANLKGNAETMQMMGLGLIGGIYANKSEKTLDDSTPVSRLTQEPIIFVVSADSKYKTMDDLIADWKANPRKVTVGSGSNPGGSDHVPVVLVAKEAGIDPKQVNHISYDGGGELNTALLGNKISFGSTGVSEVTEQIKAGKLRALAVTSAERAEAAPDVPTLTEQGIDLDYVNWRGLIAPPELSDADKEKLETFVQNVAQSEQWKAALQSNGWTEAFMASDEFAPFAQSETDRVAGVMQDLGLAT